MNKTYTKKLIYFLSLDKIEKQHGEVPEDLLELNELPVLANEKLNCGVIGDNLVSLDWCDAIPAMFLSEGQVRGILENFKDEELYVPLEEVLYDRFVREAECGEMYQYHVAELAKALGFALRIISEYKEHISLTDLMALEGMKLHLKEAIFGEDEE